MAGLSAGTKRAIAELLARVAERSKKPTAEHLPAAAWAKRWGVGETTARRWIKALRAKQAPVDVAYLPARRGTVEVYKLPPEFYP